MMLKKYWWRSFKDKLVVGLAAGATFMVLLPLGAIFGYLVYRAIGSLNWNFLTQIPKPPRETGGGIPNAIAGSGLIRLIASLFGVPMGIATGAPPAALWQTAFGYPL